MFKCYAQLQLKEEIPMAVSDIEAVVEFLRSNGFSDSEAALMEDVMEKSQLGSSDFQKFLFPMVPPLPPVKIPADFRRSEPELPAEDAVAGLISPSDEGEDFVSFASSTTELCSSDFTNPYAVHTTTRPSSQASSDRMSQFGTARDYHEFDMQNDIYWLKEKDEDYVMPPPFGVSDMNGDPTEDKFVMTVETQKNKDFSLDNHYYDDGQWSVEKKENQGFIDHYHFDGVLKAADQDFIQHTCSELCACSGEEAFAESDPHREKSRNDGIIEFESPDLSEEDFHANENGSNRPNDGLVPSDISGPDEVADDEVAAPDDELLPYQTREDEYEVFTLRIIHRKNRTGFEEIKDFPIVLNTIVAGRYYITEYLGSAAFSKVAQARDLHTGMDVCLKIIKNDKDFFDQSLDEIKLLKYVNKHDPGDDHHILRLYDYFYFREHLFIVCELLRANLYEFQKFNKESGGEPYFTLSRLQVITRQCLEALVYLHGLGIMHCDLKPENILIKSYRRCEIKVIDLGSSCFQTDHLSTYVQSRSYRAPEVILGDSYDQKIDLWSLGCILAELYSGEVLFPNEAIALLLARVIAILGPFDVEMLERGQEAHKYFTNEYDLYYINEETNELEYIIAEDSSPLEQHLQISDSLFLDFLSSLLETNPLRRPTAREALDHPWLSHPYQELDPSS